MRSGAIMIYEVIDMIYLDNAASTSVSMGVQNKLTSVLAHYGNPSSLHAYGYSANNEILIASELIASKINCSKDEIYYTSGATMSNNIFIQGFMKRHPDGQIIYSAVEHNDIIMLCESYGAKAHKLSVNHDGSIDYVELRKLNNEYENVPVLNVIQCANGETGVIQNIKSITQTVHDYSQAWIYMDATQYIPYYPIDVEAMGIDAMGMSGQKIHCIKGTGMLYINKNVEIDPVIYGEQGLIGGTPNVFGIACLGQAFKELKYDNTDALLEKISYFGEELGVQRNTNMPTLPNNLNIQFDGINAEQFVELLSEMGVCASAGSACSSGNAKPSHVLLAMGYSPEEAGSFVRFTISEETSYKELDKAVDIINYCKKVMGGNAR
jgi:cysteine desulfurase